MLVQFGSENLSAEWNRATVCIGTFDGIHLGHQEVIRTAVTKGHEQELPCVVVSFDRHPMSVLAPDKCPPSLATLEQKLELLSSLGVSIAVILAFDRLLANLTHNEFFDDILIKKLHASCVVIGHDFAFGLKRQGTAEWLRRHIETIVVPPYMLDNRRVSSGEIRQDVLAGKVEEASILLGRHYRLTGIVVEGQKLGRTIGFPTVNLARSVDLAVPADGVYAGVAETPFGRFAAAIGIGNRPTVQGSHRTIEAFLIDYHGDSLYGAPVSLDFVSKIRNEMHYTSLDLLADQMSRDVEQTRATTQRHI